MLRVCVRWRQNGVELLCEVVAQMCTYHTSMSQHTAIDALTLTLTNQQVAPRRAKQHARCFFEVHGKTGVYVCMRGPGVRGGGCGHRSTDERHSRATGGRSHACECGVIVCAVLTRAVV